jgi:acyl-CoA reductase-like NAD-dependent aldehyde dehydrogenase
MSEPAPVRTTYRLRIGGEFRRSESGRTFEVRGADGAFLASAALASGRDVRDAVAAARAGFAGWSGATAYQRGRQLYRVGELIAEHRARFAGQVSRSSGIAPAAAQAEVDAAVDRWFWYTGWTDKIAQVGGAANAVTGPYVNVTVPEPAGVVAVLAPQDSPLLGLVSVLAPAIAGGNAAVVVASERYPLPALGLAEVCAAARLPDGVVNVLTGEVAEVAPWLAAHQDVNAIDLAGAPGALADDLAVAAAGTLKRVVRLPEADWTAEPGLDRMFATLESKTVWQPVNAGR